MGAGFCPVLMNGVVERVGTEQARHATRFVGRKGEFFLKGLDPKAGNISALVKLASKVRQVAFSTFSLAFLKHSHFIPKKQTRRCLQERADVCPQSSLQNSFSSTAVLICRQGVGTPGELFDVLALLV
jgi:hypothetical protein